MPLAKIADLIKTQITSLDAATEAIQASAVEIDASLDGIEVAVVSMQNKQALGAPTGGTPFSEQNAAAVALIASEQVVKASAGAGTHIVINGVDFTNTTAAEVAILQLEDEDDNIIAGPYSVGDPAVSGKGYLSIKFAQPISLPSDKDLKVACVTDVGDSFALVHGYTIAD